MMAAVTSVILMILIFLLLQKYLVKGYTCGRRKDKGTGALS